MATRRTLLRAIDANRNRALEGLRVCEDVIRFGFHATTIVKRLRAIRHGVAHAIHALPAAPGELLRARDTTTDIGRRFKAPRLSSTEQVVLVNFQRVKEALRVLEELSRLLAPAKARAFQRFRFDVYAVERSVLLHVATLRHS